MGSFWKKVLRLSGARSQGLGHGADFNASEVRRHFWGSHSEKSPNVGLVSSLRQRVSFLCGHT